MLKNPWLQTTKTAAASTALPRNTVPPCFVAYYRRYLPYFQKVRELVESGAVGNVVNVQIRFAVPLATSTTTKKNLPWRVQPDIAGGGYFTI